MTLKLPSLWCLFFVLCLNAWAEPTNQFSEINLQRKGRVSLVKTAIAQNLAYETELGYLKAREGGSLLLSDLVEVENGDRERQFTLIAKSSKATVEKVGRDFALKNGYHPLSGAEVQLRLHGSNTIGASLMPALVTEFLKSEFKEPRLSEQKKGVETTLFYQTPDSGGESYAVQIVAHGSSTAFQETKTNHEVGLLGGFCDIGMASRPIKEKEAQVLIKNGHTDLRAPGNVFPIAVDGVAVIVHPSNPVDELSVLQIAQIFSKEVKNWKELGGPDLAISVLSRDTQSGTYDTFKSRVLKPTGKSLSVSKLARFEQNSAIVSRVSHRRGTIGFVGLSALNSGVRALSVKAAEGTRAFFPSRLTLKSLDYPLSRLLYLYAPEKRSALAGRLLSFVMSDAGQRVVDRIGLVGQGLATSIDREQAAEFKKALVEDRRIPEVYRTAIAEADREDTGFNVRFLTGKVTPNANSVNNLKRLVNLLAEPELDRSTVVLIGFADSRGEAKINEKLSKKRADTVAELLRRHGVQQVETRGLGEIMPVGDNLTQSGRAANRRVEVWLKRKS